MSPLSLPLYRRIMRLLFAGATMLCAGLIPSRPVQAVEAAPIAAEPAAKSADVRKIKYYKSTMVAGEVSDKPGKDSMGMEREPVYDSAGSSAAVIVVDAGTLQRMNLKTGLTTRGAVRRTIRAVGYVTFDERGLSDITTKYDGWLEKLDVNATWTAVHAGDPLFEIYSTELYNAQLNYLVALRAEGASGGPLTRSAGERLRLFDLPSEFVADLAKSGKVRRTYLYRSPASGFVVEKMAVAGQMMKAGERIYRLADLSTVWIDAEIYEGDLAAITPGLPAEVRLSYGSSRVFRGSVAQILPRVDEPTRTGTARVVMANPDGFLRPGMFAEVRFDVELAADAVLVPDSAVLRSGERNTVFVALDGGHFEARSVVLGDRTDDYRYEVLSGLKAGERVVTSGQFLLDSESQLREAIQKLLGGSSSAGAAPPVPSSGPTPGANAPAMPDMPGMGPANPPQSAGK